MQNMIMKDGKVHTLTLKKGKMERILYPLYYGGHMMRWSKACAVKNPKGIVWIAGTEGRDPNTDEVVEGMEAQMRMCLEKLKANLEEAGSGLEYIVHMTWEIMGKEFPDGIEQYPPFQVAEKVFNDFFLEHCGAAPIPVAALPEYKTFKATGKELPLVIDLMGVSGLAKKGMVVELGCTAVIP